MKRTDLDSKRDPYAHTDDLGHLWVPQKRWDDVKERAYFESSRCACGAMQGDKGKAARACLRTRVRPVFGATS